MPSVDGGKEDADASVASIMAELGGADGAASADSGTVVHVKGSVARVQGLAGVKMGAVVRIGAELSGLVVSLESKIAVVALLGEENAAASAATAAVGEPASVQLLADEPSLPLVGGGVFSPLGAPLPPHEAAEAGTAEVLPLLGTPLPAISARVRSTQPLLTGLKVVDTFFPLAHGQKLGMVGDRGTGKRQALLDLLRNQRQLAGLGGGCVPVERVVYVSVGQSPDSVSKLAEDLGSEASVVVAAPTDTWGMHYLAPYAGLALANAHRARGEHVMLVIDDSGSWTGAAVAQAERFVGHALHGAAPLHASVLEHAGALRSGGSLTALCVGDTENEELGEPALDAVVSLADVLLPFSAALANAGTRPALSLEGGLGLGGSAPYQPAPLRALARQLRKTLRETADDSRRAEMLVEQMGLDLDEEADDAMKANLASRAVIESVLDQGRLKPAVGGAGITRSATQLAQRVRGQRPPRAMLSRGGGAGAEASVCTPPAELLLGLQALVGVPGAKPIPPEEWAAFERRLCGALAEEAPALAAALQKQLQRAGDDGAVFDEVRQQTEIHGPCTSLSPCTSRSSLDDG